MFQNTKYQSVRDKNKVRSERTISVNQEAVFGQLWVHTNKINIRSLIPWLRFRATHVWIFYNGDLLCKVVNHNYRGLRATAGRLEHLIKIYMDC